MSRSVRKILFYVLLVVFFMVSPIFIFYSLGYRWDFIRMRFEETGGIFVKSGTRGISIFLNNRLVKETPFFSSGALLAGIVPGPYLIRIEKPGYQPFSKAVEVSPSWVNELRHILLIPQNLSYATSSPAELEIILATTTPSFPPAIDGLHSFQEFDGEIFFVNQNGFFGRRREDTKTIEILGRPGFYLTSKNPLKFLKSETSQAVAILDPSGGAFLFEEKSGIQPLDGGVNNLAFDGSGSRLLLQKERSLEVRWLADNPYQPFQKRGTKEVILRTDRPILDAGWFYGDNMHIVIRSDYGIFLTELDGRGGRHTVELLSDPTDRLAVSPQIPRAIFFKKEKNWFKVEL